MSAGRPVVTRRSALAGGVSGIATLVLPGAATAASDGGPGVATASLLAWAGAVDDPQLGEAADPLATVWEPAVASSLTGWTAVAVGPTQCVGIRDGRLYGWGSNVSGATGQGTTTGDTTLPTEIVVPGVTTWTAVAAGGDNSGGFSTSLAIGDGRLFAFGDHDNAGMCGLGATVSGDVTTPTQVGDATDWTAVSAGLYHVLAIRGGALHAWGYNLEGALGLGSGSPDLLAEPTQVGSATDWTACSAGMFATSAGIRSGTLYSWGFHSNGVTGQGLTAGSVTAPVQVGSATDWTAVAVGSDSAAGIRAGALYAWGANSDGKTGLGSLAGTTSSPQQVGSETGWSRVAVSASVMLAVRAGGLYAAGPTDILGLPTGSGLPQGSTARTSPTRVGTASDWSAVAVSNLDGRVAAAGIRG